MNKSYAIIFASLFTCACDSKPNTQKWKPPSKEQVVCIEEVNKRLYEATLEDAKEYLDQLQNDAGLIRAIIKQRRDKELLCMAKARCYEISQGIEFAGCVEDSIPEQ